jgi:hypothetical protein
MSDLFAMVLSMTSVALQTWRTQRLGHIDELLATHRLVRGVWPGRWRRTAAINAALVLRLAAEFQGFARDLHDEACEAFAERAASANPVVKRVAVLRLQEGRDLDRGNAHPGSLGRDFGRFGFDVWQALHQRDRRTHRHNRSLEQLNAARNALAHSDGAKLAVLRANGCHVILNTFRRWHGDLDALAGNLDAEVGAWLGQAFGRQSPW